MDTPHTPPSHCLLQVLLVSPPTLLPPTTNTSGSVWSKPFSPWKPGDAYSVENDLTDWRLLLGSIDDGDQTRYWDHKDKRWYYHSSKDSVSTEDTGSTGGLVVVVLIILLTLYSLRRLWVVWAEILNFDGTNSPRGWDFVVQWVLHIIQIKRRRRRKRHRKRRNNNNIHVGHHHGVGHHVAHLGAVNQTSDTENDLNNESPCQNGHFFRENSSVVINFEQSRPDVPVPHQVVQSQDLNHCSSFATLV